MDIPHIFGITNAKSQNSWENILQNKHDTFMTIWDQSLSGFQSQF